MTYDIENAHVLLLEAIPVLQRSHTHSIAFHLTSVGWTNSTLSSTNLQLTTVQLIDSIANLMEIEHDMSSVGDKESTVITLVH